MPTTPATIRRATTADAAIIESLIQRYVASGTLLPRSVEFIEERASDFLVATVGDHVVGCVHLEEYSPSLAEVRSLVVEPSWQGRGIGAALVRALEELAMVREFPLVFAVSNNEAFFLSQGYAPRDIPELDRERNAISRFKGVYALEIGR